VSILGVRERQVRTNLAPARTVCLHIRVEHGFFEGSFVEVVERDESLFTEFLCSEKDAETSLIMSSVGLARDLPMASMPYDCWAC